MKTLNEESADLRADPVVAFGKAFRAFFGHYFTPEDALRLWESQLKNGMWVADDSLFIFRFVLDLGAEGLGKRIREATRGTFSLTSYVPDASPDDDEAYHAWFTTWIDTLQARFDEACLDESIVEEEIFFAPKPEGAIREALEGVPFWARDVQAKAEDARSEYCEGAWRVRLTYVLPYR